MITSKDTRELIDSFKSKDWNELRKSFKENDDKISYFMTLMKYEANNFWPAISQIMLGQKRLRILKEISRYLIESDQELRKAFGLYLYHVLLALQQAQRDIYSQMTNLLIESNNLKALAAEKFEDRKYDEAKTLREKSDELYISYLKLMRDNNIELKQEDES